MAERSLRIGWNVRGPREGLHFSEQLDNRRDGANEIFAKIHRAIQSKYRTNAAIFHFIHAQTFLLFIINFRQIPWNEYMDHDQFLSISIKSEY